jgi:hypothetical protein
MTRIASFLSRSPFFWHHLFITDTSPTGNQIIPNQSITDIEICSRLGTKIMEFNTHILSDGSFIVCHGRDNKWGYQFYHTEGTDITDVDISSCTLEYVKTYIRNKSTYAKFRTAPLTLEEALLEAKARGITPLIMYKDVEMALLAERIMGRGNYILYKHGDVPNPTNAEMVLLGTYNDGVNPKKDIDLYNPLWLNVVMLAETPDSTRKDVVDYLHQKGLYASAGDYNQGSKYGVTPQRVQDFMKMGVDIFASDYSVNFFADGNLCNLYGDIDYSDFNHTGTVDTYLILEDGDTVQPNASMNSVFLGKGYLRIRYSGTLNISLGKISGDVISDGESSNNFSSVFVENTPTFTLTAVGNVTIYEIEYHASKC